MVYEDRYEHGYEKERIRELNTLTEGKIQDFTLASISSLEHPQH